MLHWKMPKPEKRPPTERRIAAAERFLAKERDKFALFADQLDQLDQPTAEQRIEAHEEGYFEHQIYMRKHQADMWRKCRRLLEQLAPEHAASVNRIWRGRRYPLNPAYLAGLVQNVVDGKVDPIKEGADLARVRVLGSLTRFVISETWPLWAKCKVVKQ